MHILRSEFGLIVYTLRVDVIKEVVLKPDEIGGGSRVCYSGVLQEPTRRRRRVRAVEEDEEDGVVGLEVMLTRSPFSLLYPVQIASIYQFKSLQFTNTATT